MLPSSCNLRNLLDRALLGAVGLLLATGAILTPAESAVAQTKTALVAPPTPPHLAAMHTAVRTQSYTAILLRRFRDGAGGVVTVREKLEVAANGTPRPDFRMQFQAVVGEPPGSPLEQEWAATYEKYSDLFFRHGTFRIRDVAKASGNYNVADFGQVSIANRSADCLVVYPYGSEKAIWVVYCDSQTKLPLYVAEFDDQLRLFTEYEVLQLTPSMTGWTIPAPPAAQSTVSTFAPGAFSTARAMFAKPSVLVEPAVVSTGGFELEEIEVRDDPLNGRRKLVLGYSDGIDQFLIVQQPGIRDPFGGLPSQTGGANTIARFRDPALSALVFWDEGVAFHVAGRGSLGHLDDVAQIVYRQALLQ